MGPLGDDRITAEVCEGMCACMSVHTVDMCAYVFVNVCLFGEEGVIYRS